MRGTLVKLVGMSILLVAFGCRTPQPNLKPPPAQEAYNTPPTERRYNASVYPKEAFNSREPLKRLHTDSDIIPTRGPSTSPSMMQNNGIR